MDADSPVMVATQDPVMGQLVANLLTNLGLRNVHAVAGGGDALAILESAAPALLVAEASMTSVDGIALLRQLRRSPALASSGCILIGTRTTYAALSVAAQGAGNTVVVTKPINTLAMKRALDNFLDLGS